MSYPDFHELAACGAALAAAERCGLLAALLERSATAEQFASSLGLDPVATERVLDVLRTQRAVEKIDGEYRATPTLVQAYRGPDRGFGWDMWAHVPTYLATGERFAFKHGTREERERAYARVTPALGTLFEAAANELATKLPPARRILDVGAGSGVWGLAQLARDEQSHATALDLPAVLDNVRDRATALGLLDRVSLLPGDYHAIDLEPGGFDRIVAANILHLETPDDAARLVRRLAAALAEGGELVVVDAFSDGSEQAERCRAAYALHLALRTGTGYPHAEGTIIEWMNDAGLTPRPRQPLDAPPHVIGALIAS